MGFRNLTHFLQPWQKIELLPTSFLHTPQGHLPFSSTLSFILQLNITFVFTGRLPWQPAGIKFTHCVSGQRSAFSPLQEKLCIGSKNDSNLFELSRGSLSACKVLGEIELRAPAVGVKIVFFLYVTLGLPACGVIVQTSIVWRFISRFSCGFQRFLQNGLLFQTHYIVLIFVARWRHNFREIAVKNCEKSKNRWKSLCAPLRIDIWGIWRKKNSTAVV